MHQHRLAVHRSRQDHALRLDASDYGRSKVGNHNDLSSHKILRVVELGDTRHDLPFFGAE